MKWMWLVVVAVVFSVPGVRAEEFKNLTPTVILSKLAVRPALAVMADNKIYFASEAPTQECPWRNIYEAALNDASKEKNVRLVASVDCVQDIKTDGKNLFVMYGPAGGAQELSVLENGALVAIEKSQVYGANFRHGRAWTYLQLDILSDVTSDKGFLTPVMRAWSVQKDHAVLGEGVFLSFLVSSSEKPESLVCFHFPLDSREPSLRKKTVLKTGLASLEKLSFNITGNGDLLFRSVAARSTITVFDGETGERKYVNDGAEDKDKPVNPLHVLGTKGGFLAADVIRHNQVAASGYQQRVLTRDGEVYRALGLASLDVSGLSSVGEGLLVSKGRSRAIVFHGATPVWKDAQAYTVKSEPADAALFPQSIPSLSCQGYVVEKESATEYSISRLTNGEVIPLAFFSGLRSLVCVDHSIGFVANRAQFVALAGHATFDVVPDTEDVAGTNIKTALDMKVASAQPNVDPAVLTLAAGENKALFFLMEKEALKIARKPLGPSDFTILRPREKDPRGYNIFLSVGEAAFTKYVNTIGTAGRDFYAEETANVSRPETNEPSYLEAVK